jgi:adenylylsulfate kinase
MRSMLKALSWRVVASLLTALLVYAFTREPAVSAAIGGVEFFAKLVMYWLHERAWNRLPFGRVPVDVDRGRPGVLWLTGLSGAGKSTIAGWVADELRRRGLRVEQLDGDAIRDILPNTGFTKAERDAHIRRVGYLASKLEQNGVFVVASFVSPYAEGRNFVRALCRRFVEVHIATPLAECERRDVKGLYAKARRGEIHNFTGIDDPYEPPVNPDLIIDTSGISVAEAGRRVLAILDEQALRSTVDQAAWRAKVSTTA